MLGKTLIQTLDCVLCFVRVVRFILVRWSSSSSFGPIASLLLACLALPWNIAVRRTVHLFHAISIMVLVAKKMPVCPNIILYCRRRPLFPIVFRGIIQGESLGYCIWHVRVCFVWTRKLWTYMIVCLRSTHFAQIPFQHSRYCLFLLCVNQFVLPPHSLQWRFLCFGLCHRIVELLGRSQRHDDVVVVELFVVVW